MPIIVGSASVVLILAGLAICYRNNNKGEATEGGEYFEGGLASFEDKVFVFPNSEVDVTETMATVIFILNILTGSLGTLISACADKKGFNKSALLVGLLQFLLAYVLIGWIWGVLHGYAIYKKNVGKS